MNKGVILIFSTALGIAGSYVPVLLGNSNLLDGWSVLGGFVGGLLGIWLGAAVSRRWG
jgi:hypothetical protein